MAYINLLRLCPTAASGDKTVLGFIGCAGGVAIETGETAGEGVCVVGGDWIGAVVGVVYVYWLSSGIFGAFVYGRPC